MEVKITRDGALEIHISQEKASTIPGRPKITLIENAFWDTLKKKAPASVEKARNFTRSFEKTLSMKYCLGLTG